MSKTTVEFLSTLEMVGFLKLNGTASRFVAMTSQTPVVKIKVGNPWGASTKTKSGLYKVSRKIGIINANYNLSVRNRIAEKLGVQLSEVEYENGDVWYQHLKTSDGKNLPLVQHKDEAKRGDFYIQYYPHKSTNAYVNESGEVIPDATVEPYLYKESERPDFKPTVIVVNLSNVRQLKASGVIINMPDLDEAEAILAQ
jgi:hypothetical protein